MHCLERSWMTSCKILARSAEFLVYGNDTNSKHKKTHETL